MCKWVYDSLATSKTEFLSPLIIKHELIYLNIGLYVYGILNKKSITNNSQHLNQKWNANIFVIWN